MIKRSWSAYLSVATLLWTSCKTGDKKNSPSKPTREAGEQVVEEANHGGGGRGQVAADKKLKLALAGVDTIVVLEDDKNANLNLATMTDEEMDGAITGGVVGTALLAFMGYKIGQKARLHVGEMRKLRKEFDSDSLKGLYELRDHPSSGRIGIYDKNSTNANIGYIEKIKNKDGKEITLLTIRSGFEDFFLKENFKSFAILSSDTVEIEKNIEGFVKKGTNLEIKKDQQRMFINIYEKIETPQNINPASSDSIISPAQ